jgi:hypothetical protein
MSTPAQGPDPQPERDIAAAAAAVTAPAPIPALAAHKPSLREKVEDLLSGPPAARIISGALFVIVALAVSIAQFRDLWEKWHNPSFDHAAHSTEQPKNVDRYSGNVRDLAESFRLKVSLCQQNEACIASALSALPQEVPSKEGRYAVGERLFADQVVGEVVRTSDDAMKLLREFYGANEGFLGTGLSKPSDQKSFAAARFPEYLVPNYPETHDGVMVWKLAGIQYLHKNLFNTLSKMPPDNAKGWKPARLKLMRDAMKQGTAWNAELPAVVRFALIPEGKYSRCLGLPAAHHVFTSNFGLMKANGLTVEQAAQMSGYQLPLDASEELYVFVFVPAHGGELMVPTWRNMVSPLSSEIAKPSPCAAASPPA